MSVSSEFAFSKTYLRQDNFSVYVSNTVEIADDLSSYEGHIVKEHKKRFLITRSEDSKEILGEFEREQSARLALIILNKNNWDFEYFRDRTFKFNKGKYTFEVIEGEKPKAKDTRPQKRSRPSPAKPKLRAHLTAGSISNDSSSKPKAPKRTFKPENALHNTVRDILKDSLLLPPLESKLNDRKSKSKKQNELIRGKMAFDKSRQALEDTLHCCLYYSRNVPESTLEKDEIKFRNDMRVYKTWRNVEDYENQVFEEFTGYLREKVLEILGAISKKRIFLVAVPSSTANERNTIMESIKLIEKDLKWKNYPKKVIYDASDTLVRTASLKKSHKSIRRNGYDDHRKTIKCSKKLPKEDSAFIIVDDVITTGASMGACRDILIDAGADEKDIYLLAIGKTKGMK